MPIPIVFIHTGFAEHLWIATRQARISNPDSPIILIGDSTNRRLRWPTEHYQVADHWESANKFAEHYVHRSSNGFNYELFCFQRWFVLLDWMQKHDIQSCWCCDSDVLVYSDLGQLAGEFEKRGLVICSGSGHSLLIQDRQALQEACELMVRMYTDEKYIFELTRLYESLAGEPGGVSDMSAFRIYAAESPERVSDSGEVHEHGVIDAGMHVIDQFEGDVRKTIHWVDGTPHCRHRESGDLVRFHTLHFQGGNKRLMPKFASNPDLGVAGIWLRRKTITRLKRVRRSVQKRMRVA